MDELEEEGRRSEENLMKIVEKKKRGGRDCGARVRSRMTGMMEVIQCAPASFIVGDQPADLFFTIFLTCQTE